MTKSETMVTQFEYRRKERAVAAAFLKALYSEIADLQILTDAHWAVDDHPDPTVWRTIIRSIAREKPKVDPLHQMYFAGEIWGSLPLAVKDDPALFTALRAILPPYCGRKPLHLFRGASDREIGHRIGARSWSADISISDSFAREHKNRVYGEGVVLSTLAPPEAILCDVTDVDGMRDESEYIVDCRFLSNIEIVRRYPKIGILPQQEPLS